jgi:GNAT superfamily N-acetyltransferase
MIKNRITKGSLTPLPEDLFCISLEPKTSSSFGQPSEPYKYIHKTTGIVSIWNDDDEEETIGIFKIKVVDLQDAERDHVSAFDVMDAHSTTIRYFESLFNLNSDTLKDSLIDLLDQRFGWFVNFPPNLLILDRLVIDPAYRGHGVGLNALDAIIRRYGLGIDLVAMNPFPLQFESVGKKDIYSNEMEDLDAKWSATVARKGTLKANTKKLQAYYARLGFILAPKSDYMVRPPILHED